MKPLAHAHTVTLEVGRNDVNGGGEVAVVVTVTGNGIADGYQFTDEYEVIEYREGRAIGSTKIWDEAWKRKSRATRPQRLILSALPTLLGAIDGPAKAAARAELLRLAREASR